jgi:hypothetical protein
LLVKDSPQAADLISESASRFRPVRCKFLFINRNFFPNRLFDVMSPARKAHLSTQPAPGGAPFPPDRGHMNERHVRSLHLFPIIACLMLAGCFGDNKNIGGTDGSNPPPGGSQPPPAANSPPTISGTPPTSITVG